MRGHLLTPHQPLEMFERSGGSLVRSAISANGVIHFKSQDNNLCAISSYGSVLACASLGADYFGSSAVSDGSVFVAAAVELFTPWPLPQATMRFLPQKDQGCLHVTPI
jgi:hypothetical protein